MFWSTRIVKLFGTFLTLGLLLLSLARPALALDPEQRRFLASGARYYDISLDCASSEANGKIYFLGDSLTVGMRDQGGLSEKFQAQSWSDITVQATNGISITDSLPRVDNDEETVTAASTAVVGLGTARGDGGNYEAKVSELITKLRSFNEELRIYWVNIYSQPGAFIVGGEEENQRLNQILTRKSAEMGFTVINWQAEATDNLTEYPFIADGVHHTPEGYSAKAEFLAEEVGTPPADVGGGGTNSGGSSEPLNAEDPKPQIFGYLLGKEVHGVALRDFHVAGIMGNMWAESGFQPQRLQGTPSGAITPAEQVRNSGSGYGLVQWTPAGKMINPTIAAGKDPNNWIVQLDFLLGQLNGTDIDGQSGQRLVQTTDVGAATLEFETGYERHAGPPQPERIVQAQQILDAGYSGGGGDECDNGGDSDFSSTVLDYAWETYHQAPYLEVKPAYEEAISAAQSGGQFVGGGSHPGVDCGGFVTRLMIDSSFEPEFNFGGNIADGAANVSSGIAPWLEANWERVTVSGTQDLRPGDVAVYTSRSHTFVYVGEIAGFGGVSASASIDERAPMAGSEDGQALLANNIEWYRQGP